LRIVDAFVDVAWKLAILQDPHIHRLIEHHGKPIRLTANDAPHDTEPLSECKNGKLDVDRPALSDPSPGADEYAIGAYIGNQIPKGSLLDGIFGGKQRSVASVLAAVGDGIHHFSFDLVRVSIFGSVNGPFDRAIYDSIIIAEKG
ncbi:MAG: hypothetical protein WBY88_05135, partial [Desulfosarcina sp.]